MPVTLYKKLKKILNSKLKAKHFIFLSSALLIISAFICLRLVPPDAFSEDLLASPIEDICHPFQLHGINKIAGQKFFYLGNGMQSIAFVSEDKQYVFKFFLKHKIHKKARVQPARFLKKPLPEQSVPSDKNYVLKSYHTAFEKIKDQSGLIALHLNRYHNRLPHLKVTDYRGKEHILNLNNLAFVVQKYGLPLRKVLSNMSRQKRQLAFLELNMLLEKIALTGFVNNGKSFNEKNFAFAEGRPIMIDLGNIKFSDEHKQAPQKEILRLKKLLQEWQKNFLKNKSYFSSILKAK